MILHPGFLLEILYFIKKEIHHRNMALISVLAGRFLRGHGST